MSDFYGGSPYAASYGSPYAPVPPRKKLFLPTKLKDSMRFFQVPARRWWWGLIALVVYVVCYVIVMYATGFVMFALEPASSGGTTPTDFLVNNISIATDIVLCTLIAWVFFRQGFGWLVSVVGRFRWAWMGVTLGIFAAGYAVETIVEIIVYGPTGYGLGDMEMKPYTWFMAIGILVTTPLQCAGEEFQSRALLPRLITSIIPFRVPGLVLSALVPSAVFMYLHSAQDPWLNINYFCVALMMWWLAYRTGGIEASIALHFVNNIFSEWMLPFTDFSDMFDRSEGTGSPVVLVYVGVELILVLIVDWVARRKGVVRMSAPAASIPAVVKPRRFVTMVEGSIVEATEKDLPRIATTPRETPVILSPSFVVPPPSPVVSPPSFVVLPQAGSPYPPSPVVVPPSPVVVPPSPVVLPPSPVILPQAGSPSSYGSDSPSSRLGPVPPTGPRRTWIDDPGDEGQ